MTIAEIGKSLRTVRQLEEECIIALMDELEKLPKEDLLAHRESAEHISQFTDDECLGEACNLLLKGIEGELIARFVRETMNE